ncbi:MAG: isoprenyl transferase [Raoultibacter sp.]
MLNTLLSEIFPNPPAGLDPAALVEECIPAHVAIIMDGNGRWAKQRGKNRLEGHRAGIDSVRESIRCASDLGVRYLTIYSFSSENWKRPQDEVTGLMDLFAKTMLAEVDGLHEKQVRVMAIGHLAALPKKTRAAFASAWEKTKNNTGMTLVVAVNYGGRFEILDAVRRYTDEALSAQAVGCTVPELTEESFSNCLYTAHVPDPELMIRTSGEMRISNFLLWQVAYTEIYCTEVLWPDFDRYEFLRALLDYQARDRRFGAV